MSEQPLPDRASERREFLSDQLALLSQQEQNLVELLAFVRARISYADHLLGRLPSSA